METQTLEFLRAGWPIVLALVMLIIWVATEASLNKHTRSDFKEFTSKEYPRDKDSLVGAIKEVRDAQEKSEARLEAKLDKISEQSSSQLEKVYNEINRTNILLAEMKGRLSNGSQATDSIVRG